MTAISAVFLMKTTPASFADAEELQQEHRFVDSAVKGEMVGIRLPFQARRGDQVYIWREKSGNRGGENELCSMTVNR